MKSGVKEAECVAAHMYRMAVLTFLFPANTVNQTKCMKMALVHDLAESLVGDITPQDGITAQEKLQRERCALEEIVSLLPDDGIAQEIVGLFEEFEQGETPESEYVRDADKFDMIMTALEYEAQYGYELESFYVSTRNVFKTPFFQDLDHELLLLREKIVKDRPALDSCQEI